MNRPIIALAAALAASPTLAAQDYPPGLFENSPVVPSGPPGATFPSGPPDATATAPAAPVKKAHRKATRPSLNSDVPEGMKGLW
jgi:hypothetical protein